MIDSTDVSGAEAHDHADREDHASDTPQLGRVGAVATADAPDDEAGRDTGLLIPELIEQIHSGQVDVDSLAPDIRQQCVGHLVLEGFRNTEIAQLMRVSERTVTRDRVAVRRDDALAPDSRLGDQLLGEFEKMTMGAVQRLTRLAGDTQNPAYARLWAEEAIVRIYQRLIDTVHRLHYFEDGKARLEGSDASGIALDEDKILAALAKLGAER